MLNFPLPPHFLFSHVQSFPASSLQYELLFVYGGFAVHEGRGGLYEEAVTILCCLCCSIVYTGRYPESLADKSFDNTGC
jgi:hypothetical protein